MAIPARIDRNSLLWRLSILLTASLLTSCVATTKAQEAERLVDALAASITQWHHDLEFYCTYELLEGYAVSLEDALAERYSAEPRVVARGEYAKARGFIRQRIDFEEPSRDFGNGWKSESDWELVRNLNTGVSLIYEREGGGALFQDTQELQGPFPQETPAAGSLSAFSPCLLFGESRRPNYLLFLRQEQSTRADVQFRILRQDSDSIIVEALYAPKGVAEPIRFTFDFLNAKPYPLMHTVRVESVKDGKEAVLLSRFTDFVQVVGSQLAKKVLVIYSTGKPPFPFLVRIWRSSDLGQRPPQHEDCLVRVASRSIGCLATRSLPPLVDGYRTVDITKLSKEDLAEECRKSPVRSGRSIWWLWAILGVTVLSLVAWGVYRWRSGH
ncbi:MAG: hypothetical protein KatS3mg110_3782 [Pirellulaceae bacterium]|nr:MAG: hypothetical protein KatS3mg110_3769 [Pirellulaceae bacterium]GIW95741.1 MAG: hypothetical protein KatS3mg110_3782 [Pirellulaceae bacterium]